MNGISALKYLRRKWQSLLLLEAVIVGMGPAILGFVIGLNFLWLVILFLISTAIYFILQKPWTIDLKKITSFVDSRLSAAEYSSGLLLKPGRDLTPMARLQKHKTEERLSEKIRRIKPQTNFERALAFLLVFSITAAVIYFSESSAINSNGIDEKNKIRFTALDSVAPSLEAPEIVKQQAFINYPSYTGLRTTSYEDMNIQTLKNSRITWVLGFDQGVREVVFESKNEQHRFQLKDEEYRFGKTVTESGFYNFRFTDTTGHDYVSKVYYLEVAEDAKPEVSIKGLPLFSGFEAHEEKVLNFQARLNDDYGVSDAYIIATVSRGSGEAIKFREEKISFDEEFTASPRSLILQKSINLEDLNMQPGEQLYFYVEAKDNLKPIENIARSETYFAEIRDTTEAATAISGSMGVDLMPDYFRSQRQLIIDTEKLLAEKDQISKQEFNSRSNELGFDQKALRLKYGEFMGDESESGIAAQSHSEEPEAEPDEDNLLEDYTHDHDSENEHNLVSTDNEEKEDPLHEYLHNHDDPEESTLFTQSLKSMLREAMNQMWDSELYLRLYEPQNSLPYQYSSLKLLQEIKNSARIYVHRIGFDPPPIKESARLSGELDEVRTYSEKTAVESQNEFKAIRQSISRLENIIQNNLELTEDDKTLFQSAAEELSGLATQNPVKFIETLGELKFIAEGVKRNVESLKQVQKGLLSAIPDDDSQPGSQKAYRDELQQLFLKELDNVE